MQLEQDGFERGGVETRLRQREAEFEQRLDSKAVRTDSLGRDRHHRSYWSLQACRNALWVEAPDGTQLGVLTTPEELYRLGNSLLETGSREHSLSQVLDASQYCMTCTGAAPELTVPTCCACI